MLHLLYVLLATARSSLNSQRELALENLALRQQLAIVQRKTKRPRLTQADRALWVALCSLWPDWHNALIIVKPQTAIGWYRKGSSVESPPRTRLGERLAFTVSCLCSALRSEKPHATRSLTQSLGPTRSRA